MKRDAPRPVPAQRWRVYVVFGVLAVGFGGVLWKSARLQLWLGDDLRQLAEEQYLRKVTVTAPRGHVVDKDGRTLAVSLPAWSVFAEPKNIVDVEATAQKIADALGQPAASIFAKINNERAFVWIERRVSPEIADKVRALDLPGVGTRKEWRRAWPNKELAAQVLGAVDVDGRGQGGVEQALDDRLTGKTARLSALGDNKGQRIAVVDDNAPVFNPDTLAGDDVVVTLDLPLQQAAEEILARTAETFHAKAAWALFLDAKTGAIRVAAQSPGFNPNLQSGAGGDRRNHAFADAIEPGSIFKVATFAAALDAGVVGPHDLIDCENGKFQLGKHTIHDTHKAAVISATEVFAASSNIGTLKIAQRLGEDRFREALTRYGFGARPGTGLHDESAGRLPKQARWGEARTATVSFGHGLLVTSLQMASLVQAVANDGLQKRPYLIERVLGPDGVVVEEHQDDAGERLMSPAAAATLRTIMEAVVQEGGTGTLAAIPGMRVGGKTGTAEKVDPNTGKYSRQMNLSSFVGFAPFDNPQLVGIVVVDEPKGVVFGGQTAGPAWRAIMERALLPQGHLGTATLAAQETLKKGLLAAKKQKAEVAPVVDVGSEGAAVAKAGVPDVRGLSARAAIKAAAAAGFDVQLSGSGLVVAQDPAAGALIDGDVDGEGDTLVLTLMPLPATAQPSTKTAQAAPGGPR
jgi:cell division protein FtsI (penicillin-binding protein 3)